MTGPQPATRERLLSKLQLDGLRRDYTRPGLIHTDVRLLLDHIAALEAQAPQVLALMEAAREAAHALDAWSPTNDGGTNLWNALAAFAAPSPGESP